MQAAMQASPVSKGRLWTGRIISALVVLFLLFDGITKLIKVNPGLSPSAQLGYPVGTIVGIGITLLVCTAFYVIPQTAVLGAILLTAYLGGAVASQVRIGNPIFDTLFPIIFGALAWTGLLLREKRLRALIPLQSQQERLPATNRRRRSAG